MSETRQIEANGLSQCVELAGPAGAPAVVLAHSLACSHEMWRPQIEALSADHRVVAYDLRGHGGSAAPDGPYSLELLVADLLALADALSLERFHYVGLSIGGMIGQQLALTAPERLLSLTLCATTSRIPPEGRAAFDERAETARRDGMAALAEPTLARWFTPPFLASQDNAAVTDLVRNMIATTSVGGYCGCAAALPGLNYGSRLGEIEPPVMYVAGETDVGAPVEVMSEMAAATPGSKLEVIESAAHLVNLEQPDHFTELALSFLASH